MTKIESMIVQITQSRPDTWLNCSGAYIGEVLALQLKGAIDSRVVDNQLQIRARLQQ